jgi:cytochrome c2
MAWHPFAGERAWAGWARAALALAALVLAACSPGERRVALSDVPGGDPAAGREVIAFYGCGSCHSIPGVAGANATVGPPLDEFAYRQFIAGRLPNNTGNLVTWIMDPQGVDPGNAMPDMGVNETDALNMAAYLATLR